MLLICQRNPVEQGLHYCEDLKRSSGQPLTGGSFDDIGVEEIATGGSSKIAKNQIREF